MRGTRRLGREPARDLVAVRAGDVAVEHDDVVLIDRELLERGVAVARDVGGDRLEAQPVADGLGEVELVLDDQHAHAPSLGRGAYRAAYPIPRTPWQRAPAWDRMHVLCILSSSRSSAGAPGGVRRRSASPRRRCVAALVLAARLRCGAPSARCPRRSLPSEASGHIEDAASLADADLPAIARLDPALLSAMREAAAAAGAEGVAFEVTSGWRSRAYQQWLLDDAIEDYGSEEIARQFVATPDRSSHVTGHAVDIGRLDAQSWLIQHGARWGICQIYANERWHFELATEPGGVCPELASGCREG